MLRLRSLIFGVLLTLIAVGLAVPGSQVLDFTWSFISVVLLVFVVLGILSAMMNTAGSGPTIRPSGLIGSSPHWSIQRHVTINELKTVDHMLSDSHRERKQRRPPSNAARYLWMALPPALTMLAILLRAVF